MRLDLIPSSFPFLTTRPARARIFVSCGISVLILLVATSGSRTWLTAWLLLAILVAIASIRQFRTRSRQPEAVAGSVGPTDEGAEAPRAFESQDQDLAPKVETTTEGVMAPGTTGPSGEPTATTTNPGPTKPRRTPKRRRGPREPLPELPAMTLIRVGPGRYIRAADPVPACVSSAESTSPGETDGGVPCESGGDEVVIPEPPGDDRQPEGLAGNEPRGPLDVTSGDERTDPQGPEMA